MKTRYFSVAAAAFVLLIPLRGTAQDNDPIQRNLLLEKDYNPEVESAGKIFSMPEIEAFKPQKADIVFSTGENLLRLTGDVTTLPPAEARIGLPDAQSKGYIRLGAGNHLHFIGDGRLNLLNNEKHFLDLNLRHRSESRPGAGSSWDNDNLVALTYGLSGKKLDFQAGLSEEFYNFHYYPSSAVSTDETQAVPQIPDQQWFSKTSLHLQLTPRSVEEEARYGVSLDEHLFFLHQLYGCSEALPLGPGELESDLKAFANGVIADKWQVGLSLRIRNFYAWNCPDESSYAHLYADRPGTNTWFELVPHIDYNWKRWAFTAGVKFSKMTGGEYNFRVAPDVSATTPLGKAAQLKLHVNGGERAFSYAEGFRENLYIDPTIRLLPEYTLINVGGSVDVRPTEMLAVKPFAGYRLVRDMAMFYNTDNPSFAALYANANHIYAGLNLSLDWVEQIAFEGGFRWNLYRASSVSGSATGSEGVAYAEDFDEWLSDNGGKMWYKPGFELNARLDVKAIRNVLITVSYGLQADRFAPVAPVASAEEEAGTSEGWTLLPNIHRLDAEVSYKLSRSLSLFVKGDNLLNRHDLQWAGCPSNGITVSGGAVYTF